MPARDMKEGANLLSSESSRVETVERGSFRIFNSNSELGLLEATDYPRALQVEIAF